MCIHGGQWQCQGKPRMLSRVWPADQQACNQAAALMWHPQDKVRCMPLQRWPLLWSRETRCKPSSTGQSRVEQLCTCPLFAVARDRGSGSGGRIKASATTPSPLRVMHCNSLQAYVCRHGSRHTIRQAQVASLRGSSRFDTQMMPADSLHAPAKVALPIQRLSPFSSQPPDTRLAVVCRADASLPLLGSVRPQAPTVLSAARSGSSSCRQALSLAPCLSRNFDVIGATASSC